MDWPSKDFHHPKVVSNHFKYCHSVDDHNPNRHSPICFEYVWAAKHWQHRPFSFFLAILKMKCQPCRSILHSSQEVKNTT